MHGNQLGEREMVDYQNTKMVLDMEYRDFLQHHDLLSNICKRSKILLSRVPKIWLATFFLVIIQSTLLTDWAYIQLMHLRTTTQVILVCGVRICYLRTVVRGLQKLFVRIALNLNFLKLLKLHYRI